MLHLLVIVKLTGTFEQLKVSQEATIDMSHGHGIYIKRSISSLRQASKCYPRNHFFVSFHFFDVWNQLLLFVDVKLYELKIKD